MTVLCLFGSDVVHLVAGVFIDQMPILFSPPPALEASPVARAMADALAKVEALATADASEVESKTLRVRFFVMYNG
ncbi:MAG: hypothetical protein JW932_00230 [Deltaproteobacteria bacterium]|nr:hypothetical protein [Deltaproteobacteria bacterium]